jgi:hypothetical protein
MDEEDEERQQEEAEALTAIFGDDHVYHGATALLLVQEEGRAGLTLSVVYPHDYPSRSPPTVTATASWWSKVLRQELNAAVLSVWGQARGEVCMFDVVEWAKSKAKDRAPLQVATMPHLSHAEEGGTGTVMTVEGLAAVAVIEEAERVVEQLAKVQVREAAPSPRLPPPARRYLGPPIHHGPPLTDRKSVFVGHLARVKSAGEVSGVLEELLSDKKVAKAAHNIVAWRVTDPVTGVMEQDNDDDGESAAGGRLAHLLHLLGVTNILVVVTRWYGGIHLGADRFKHINNAARSVLEQCGEVEGKDKAKGKKKK